MQSPTSPKSIFTNLNLQKFVLQNSFLQISVIDDISIIDAISIIDVSIIDAISLTVELNSFVTELEMLLSVCRKEKQMKRRRKSKVLPEEETGGGAVDAGDVLGCLEEGFTGQRVCGSPM
ncbi:hypothetical protein R6Q59_014866 [Mikania micrantha]